MKGPSKKTRAQILNMLCVGSCVRSTSRVAGVSVNAVAKLLLNAGEACATYHDAHVRDVRVNPVQYDEIWSFRYAKQKNIATLRPGPRGPYKKDISNGDTTDKRITLRHPGNRP
ncbi:MAG TPA: hypothetical protein VKN76_09680 [Kiloniellaceae bacterium]|nr:hypothetical protein [Kiloniellaceae bacterium]